MSRFNPNARWARRELVEALRLLAAPYVDQVAALPMGVAIPDEVALTFDDAFGIVERSTLPDEVLQLLLEIDADLTSMSQRPSGELWQLSALAEDASWDRLRSKARLVLTAMGEENPSPRNERTRETPDNH